MKTFLISSFVLLLGFMGSISAKEVKKISTEGLHYIECTYKPIKDKRKRHPAPHRAADNADNSKMTASFNWAGYVAANTFKAPKSKFFDGVAGGWFVPELTPTADDSFSSIWVGMDGFFSNSTTLEQIGTEQDWVVGSPGYQLNFAWFEIFPGNLFEIVGFPVEIGDFMGGQLVYAGDNVFAFSIINFTLGIYTTIPTELTTVKGAKRNSVEWIVEAPTEGTTILPLADFTEIVFAHCTATKGTDTDPIKSDDWKNASITMVTSEGEPKAETSPLQTSGDTSSFAVLWVQEGS